MTQKKYSQNNDLLNAFREMHENDFSEKILIPMFLKLGYLSAEFYGGPTEHGRDIILFSKNQLQEIEATYVVVKKFSGTRRASDTKNLQTAITQCCIAETKEITTTDGATHLPTRLIICTPLPISNSETEGVTEILQNLKKNRRTLLDGNDIANKVVQFCPEISTKFCRGATLLHAYAHQIKQIGVTSIVYQIVSPKKIGEYFVGLQSRLKGNLIQWEPISEKSEIKVNDQSAAGISSLNRTLQKLFDLEIVRANADTHEQSIASIAKMEMEKKELLSKVIDEQSKAVTKQQMIRIRESLSVLGLESERATEKSRKAKKSIEDGLYLSKIIRRLPDKLENFYMNGMGVSEDTWIAYSKTQNMASSDIAHGSIAELIILKEEIAALYAKFGYRINPSFNDEVSRRTKIADSLLRRSELDGKIAKASQNVMALDFGSFIQRVKKAEFEISRFDKIGKDNLIDTQSILEIKESLAIYNLFIESRCLDQFFKRTLIKSSTRRKVSISLSAFLAHNENILICGEAGAGKTTTLLAYAEQLNKSGELTLFFSLYELSVLMQDPFESDSLIKAMISRMTQDGVFVSLDKLKEHFNREGCRLFLDGLDEAIDQRPDLAHSIRNMADTYSKLRIVVTSRDIGEHAASLCFLSLYLEPFTLRQLKCFIESYLEARIEKKKIQKVLRHLVKEKRLRKTLRTPLLASVLCEIACAGRALPQTEVKLYESRLELFAGWKDLASIHTKRVSFDTPDAKTICQRIALRFHMDGMRKKSIEEIQLIAHDTCSSIGGITRLNGIIQELIRPCQLLIPMDELGNFGFGHLRFQEYFTACEMLTWNIARFSKFIDEKKWESPIRFWGLIHPDPFEIFATYQYSVISTQAKSTQVQILAYLPLNRRKDIYKRLRESNAFYDINTLNRLIRDVEEYMRRNNLD